MSKKAKKKKKRKVEKVVKVIIEEKHHHHEDHACHCRSLCSKFRCRPICHLRHYGYGYRRCHFNECHHC